ncbi:MAG TPA: energy transducer TonB, partial [Marinobacter sp.]
MEAGKTIRGLLLILSILITAVILVIAVPDRVPELKPLGDSAVNSAPAIRISLAGARKPKTSDTPEPQSQEQPPEPEPEPGPEPEPEPE